MPPGSIRWRFGSTSSPGMLSGAASGTPKRNWWPKFCATSRSILRNGPTHLSGPTPANHWPLNLPYYLRSMTLAAIQALLEGLVLPHHIPPTHGLVNCQEDLLLAKGLGDVVKGPLGHGLLRRLQGAVGGDDQHQGFFVLLFGLGQHLQAIHARHLEIGQNQVEG